MPRPGCSTAPTARRRSSRSPTSSPSASFEAAAERGIAVPSQLSVTGFDDIPEAEHASPPLTTIRQPHARKGAEAVRLLLDAREGETVHLPTELVVRASTAPAPR